MKDFRRDITHRVLIGEGAMGTLLYSHGIDYCYEDLNLTKPDKIEAVHLAYVQAGADILQSNTYGANYYKLKQFGLEEKVSRINRSGLRIVKKAAGENAYAFGTVGALRGVRKSDLSLDEIKRCFREQLYSLLMEEPDGLILETYYDLEELETVLQIARSETELPIMAHVSLQETSYMERGIHITEALRRLEDLGADTVGLNCRLGPAHMIQSLREVPLPKNAALSVYPNASLPEYTNGRFTYETVPEYFGTSALKLRDEGAAVIGGCCGTTPKHIEAAKRALGEQKPIKGKIPQPRRIEVMEQERNNQEPALHELSKQNRTILVELDPPKKLGTAEYMKGAEALKEAGVDSVTLADNSLATPRICNTALGSMLKTGLDVNPLIHIACRDRNLIGLQSHLMGLHTLGLNELLVVTGDPSKVGSFPGATSVYDLSSLDLISMIKQFNEGIAYSGQRLGRKTNFRISAAFNPHVRHLHKAVERLEKKAAYGAQSFLTQPVYSTEHIEEIYEAVKHLDVPVFLGIMPLTSTRNAEFIHNEIPGIKLPDHVRNAMAAAGNNTGQAAREGMAIARELIDAAMDRFNGIYLITPFLRYDLTAELTRHIRTADKEKLKEVTAYE